MKDKDIKHLEWVYERMKCVHNENENYDYMLRFREILEALSQHDVIKNEVAVCSCGIPITGLDVGGKCLNCDKEL
jgi:hypothetical protein